MTVVRIVPPVAIATDVPTTTPGRRQHRSGCPPHVTALLRHADAVLSVLAPDTYSNVLP